MHLIQVGGSPARFLTVTVPDEAYGSGWNGFNEVPTKNAVFDKIEILAPLSLDPPSNEFVSAGRDARMPL